jgi:hypothetical protein
MIHLLITCAYRIRGLDPKLLEQRNTEYRLCLARMVGFKLPMMGIVSECSDSEYPNTVFTRTPFTAVTKIPSTAALGANGKSQQEFLSIQSCLPSYSFHDEDWILKVSGRYLFVTDDMLQLVKAAPSTCNVIYKRCDERQAYTFCFAMRWKWFKSFYSQPVERLGSKNVEQFIVEFVQQQGLQETTIHAATLGVYTNINNDGIYLTV